ncbi:DNA polymerase [Rhodoligotrophos defluvii]|uniref:DNA polymerase n=1 Tax=Rhodoligotrophos defluvii TaxID=2561934 RepID=UPI0010C9E75A|nr:DNA polymerase [Rhodoligotrophos defluvii]
MNQSKRVLRRDYETRNVLDLRQVGVYKYMEHPSADVWCCAYHFDDEPTKLWLPGDPVPEEFIEAANNPEILASAHNNQFERAAEKFIMGPRYGWPQIPLERQRCSMAQALAMGLPGSLEGAGAAVGLEIQKDMAGRRLMLQMAKPRRIHLPGSAGYDEACTGSLLDDRKFTLLPDGSVVEWWADPDKRERLHAYCITDADVERALEKRLLPLSPIEQRIWVMDQQMNERGVFIDLRLVQQASKVLQESEAKLNEEMAAVTDGEVSAITNTGQLLKWARKMGLDADSVAKGKLEEILKTPDLDPQVRRAMELRQNGARSSTAKVPKMLTMRQEDGRIRGTVQYYGAATGRWAARGVQLQNLPRPSVKDVGPLIDMLAEGNTELIDMVYGSPHAVISDCIRGMICAPPGRVIMAVDLSNIEGRVLAWLAGETWKLDAFRAFDEGRGPDIYLLTAAEILGVRVTRLTKDSPERQSHGKVPELALGFQGGVGAFQSMAVNYQVQLPDEQVRQIVDNWRAKHPKIKQLWYDLERCAIEAVDSPGKLVPCGRIAFRKVGSFLLMRLPSGRPIFYPYPRIQKIETPWGAMKDALTYKTRPGPNTKIIKDESNNREFVRAAAYGGLIAENATQGVARDKMAYGMLRQHEYGYPMILTVHDESAAEVEHSFGSFEHFKSLMVQRDNWDEGLPVAAEGFSAERYRK